MPQGLEVPKHQRFLAYVMASKDILGRLYAYISIIYYLIIYYIISSVGPYENVVFVYQIFFFKNTAVVFFEIDYEK